MQIIPPQIVGRKPSNAERHVFELLMTLELPGWTYCFHSLNLPEHPYKRACEIDFLLLGERGLLVLEVKGGGVSCRDGTWHTVTREGVPRRLKESPFTQAEQARLQLEQQLKRGFGYETVGRTVFGHGVVFPDIDFDEMSIEWAPEMVIDRQALMIAGLGDCLEQLSQFWEKKPGGRGPLSKAQVEAYRDRIRPTFDRVLSIRQLSGLVEASLHELTERQYRFLDASSANRRLILSGGAGTGKTMLAAELARRAKAAGDRVVLTCRSAVLAAFLRSQTGLDAADVVPFDKLVEQAPSGADLLIVDEAQDVINEADLTLIDRALAGGLAGGRWVLFLDANNQRGLVGRYDDAAMKRLIEEFHAAQLGLSDNCRNTTQIVKATRERTNADLGTTEAGQGEPVRFVTGSRTTVVNAVAETLEMLDTEVPLNEVVLLSPFDLAQSLFGALPDEWRHRIDRLDLLQLRRPGPGRIGFAQVADFKGLESRHVLLEEPASIDPETARRLLYVGMTRARTSLWVLTADPAEGADR
ncbi:nuclease-related domain-containing DEAD/DEAH box helicase [Salinispora arenicola]|uniref:nuclease-related domain-containing DEAD/DEAH box helicase n=1 Tax=Salinispora arenicola TaxID=168697 RepID=UPI0003709A82|nr:AAA family ATPase [Salinispora arenicola]